MTFDERMAQHGQAVTPAVEDALRVLWDLAHYDAVDQILAAIRAAALPGERSS